jgi:outer membrane protein assembly factor BamE (lipoprotein component of BamABCDE complex)
MGRVAIAIMLALCMAACAMQRAEMANQARGQMVGLSKEQVLACMGPPINKAAEGSTEVWSYSSGNNFQQASYGNGFATSTSRFCTINVTMTNGQVSAINYLGPTGGLLTQNEQCAFAIANCVQQH